MSYKTGKVVAYEEVPADYEYIRKVYGGVRRFSCVEYAAELLQRGKHSTRHTTTRLTTMRILRLCEYQRQNKTKRIMGKLYRELGPRGYEIAAELGLQLPPALDADTFAHQLAIDQITASIEIGADADPNIEMRWRFDLPRSYRLSSVGAKKRWLTPDNMRPITLMSLATGIERHIAGIEFEKGTNTVATKDRDTSAVVVKYQKIIELMLDGAPQRLFGSRYFWAFVFAGEARMRWAMHNLKIETARNPSFRKHFIFKQHPVIDKPLTGIPRATGHMATEPWHQVAWSKEEPAPFYLLK